MSMRTTKSATKKAPTKRATATPAVPVKKDAQARCWVVPKDGGAEQGPFDTKKQALDAKAGAPAVDATATKPARAKKTKEPKAKKVGDAVHWLFARGQSLGSSVER